MFTLQLNPHATVVQSQMIRFHEQVVQLVVDSRYSPHTLYFKGCMKAAKPMFSIKEYVIAVYFVNRQLCVCLLSGFSSVVGCRMTLIKLCVKKVKSDQRF